jgi:hypothetical protein
MPIKVAASDQTVALGAGMFGAVAAGVYRTVAEAQKKMGSGVIPTSQYSDFDQPFSLCLRMTLWKLWMFWRPVAALLGFLLPLGINLH